MRRQKTLQDEIVEITLNVIIMLAYIIGGQMFFEFEQLAILGIGILIGNNFIEHAKQNTR